MSEHVVPFVADSATVGAVAGLTRSLTGVEVLTEAVTRLIRAPLRVEYRGANVAYIFTPDLSGAETTRFTELVAGSKARIRFEPEEFDAIRSDIAGLTTYQNLANPTLAQTVLAVKAQSRILRAILRD